MKSQRLTKKKAANHHWIEDSAESTFIYLFPDYKDSHHKTNDNR